MRTLQSSIFVAPKSDPGEIRPNCDKLHDLYEDMRPNVREAWFENVRRPTAGDVVHDLLKVGLHRAEDFLELELEHLKDLRLEVVRRVANVLLRFGGI
jgi:hypothetical protein